MRSSQQVNRTKIIRRASSYQRIVATIICLGLAAYFGVFALAGHYQLDMGRYLGYCGFKQRTGLPCPSCGMTTATLAFARGNIAEAFHIQPAAALLYCGAVLAGCLAFVVAVFGIYFNFVSRFFAEIRVRYMVIALVIILGCGWAVTLAQAMASRN